MLIFEPDDVSSLFNMPIYDVDKLHVRILYEAKTVADGLTNICNYTSKGTMLSTKLECMTYAYSYGTYYLRLLLFNSNIDYESEYNVIYKGFLLHSPSPHLLTPFENYNTSLLSYCDDRFNLYHSLFSKQRNNAFADNYQFLATIFYKQPIKKLRIYDLSDDERLQNEINSIVIIDENLEARFKPAIKESTNYLEYKVEEFCGLGTDL